MAKVVVTGASGLLGRALMKELAAHAPVGTALTRAGEGLIRLDLQDRDATAAERAVGELAGAEPSEHGHVLARPRDAPLTLRREADVGDPRPRGSLGDRHRASLETPIRGRPTDGEGRT